MNGLERPHAVSNIFDRWAPRLIPALVFAAPLIFLLDVNDTFDLPKLALVYVVDIVLAGLWTWQSMSQRAIEIRRSPLEWPLVIFFVTAGLSTIFSLDPAISFWGSYRIYVFGWLPLFSLGLLYWFTVQAANPVLRRRVLWSAMIAGGLVGFYALLQFFGYEIFDRMPAAKGGRIWASLGNPIYMGALCMMALPLTFARLLFSQEENSGPLAPSLLAGLITAGVVLSLSRSAWLGSLSALVCLALYRSRAVARKPPRFALVLLAGVLGLLLLLPAVRERASLLFSTRENSNAARIEGWKAGIKVWRASPWLGSGPDTFFQSFRPFRSMAYIRANGTGVTQADAHNDFIQIAATQGLLGLIAMVWVLVVFFRGAIRTMTIDAWGVGILAGVIALFVQDQFNFSSVSTCAWAAVWAGLLTPATGGRRINLPAVPRVLVGGLGMLGGGLAAWLTILRPLWADLLYKQGLGYSQGGNAARALEFDRAAARLHEPVAVYRTELANNTKALALLTSDVTARQALLAEAWKSAQRLTQLHPFDPDVWNNEGVAAMWVTQMGGTNHMDDARRAFEKAVQLDPVFVDAWANLAKWEHFAGHPDAEKDSWRKVLEIDPLHPMARQVLGIKN